MTGLNLPLMFERLSDGELAALHAVDGFLAGVEARGGRPAHYGPLFGKLMNTFVKRMPKGDDPDLQARPPNPGPEAAPAEHGAPPVAVTTDRTEWLAEVRQCIVNRERWLAQVEPGTDEVNAARQRALQALRDLAGALETGGIDAAPSQDEVPLALQLSGIRDKLEPFATFARQTTLAPAYAYFAIRTRDDSDKEYVTVDMDQLRDLLRAAGMFPPEMQAPQPQAPGPAQPAEAGDPPPAPALDDEQPF